MESDRRTRWRVVASHQKNRLSSDRINYYFAFYLLFFFLSLSLIPSLQCLFIRCNENHWKFMRGWSCDGSINEFIHSCYLFCAECWAPDFIKNDQRNALQHGQHAKHTTFKNTLHKTRTAHCRCCVGACEPRTCNFRYWTKHARNWRSCHKFISLFKIILFILLLLNFSYLLIYLFSFIIIPFSFFFFFF